MKSKFLFRFVFLLFVLSFAASTFLFYKVNFTNDFTNQDNQPTVNPNSYNFKDETRSLNDNKRIGLGVYDQYQENTNLGTVIDFENLVDMKMEYNLFFKAWGDPDSAFPDYIVPYLKQYKLEPVITWEPWKRDFINGSVLQPEYSLTSIALGLHDAYIKSWADSAKAAGIPVIIRFAHEMVTPAGTKSWYPWQGEPENYILAFKHIVNIFRADGATNAKFMWNPIAYPGSGPIDVYYPGDDYVDYIGMSIINLGAGTNNLGLQLHWVNCDFVFNQQYTALSAFDKPIIISEFLSSDVGGSKALWFNQCFPLINKTTQIIGLIVVQVDRTQDISEIVADWRVNSSGSSLLNFKSGIKDGDFK